MRRKKAKHFKLKKSSLKSLIIFTIELLFIFAMIFAGYKIYNWYKENKTNKELLKSISDKVSVEEIQENNEKKVKYKIDFKGLKEQNEDTVAWIKIPNMDIEYPIVKTTNNDYYLTRSFDKTYNTAGWIFMDYKNKNDGSDKNIVLYGHNRKDGSMFGNLSDIFEEKFYSNKENLLITYVTENQYCIYQIFSAYRVEDEDYYIKTDFKSDDDFEDFIKKIESRSFVDFGIEVSEDDQIITLSTCSNANYRLAIHAKKIINE